jgi:superfamily II DNA/RNA helicase
LHAAIDQFDRVSLLIDFGEEKFLVLILTSIGSRVIDIHLIILVISYDATDHEADYVHRVGRT